MGLRNSKKLDIGQVFKIQGGSEDVNPADNDSKTGRAEMKHCGNEEPRARLSRVVPDVCAASPPHC